METVGFIGLGSQGGPMAARIMAAGYPLMVWARRPEAAMPFADQGASVAADIAELAARCDHVGLCVVDDAGVEAICAELIPAMKQGSRLVVHSTILPESCVALAARCSKRRIAFLDAPVSGGGPAAASGKLTVMCGGAVEAFDASRPILETFAGLLVRLGEVGSGQQAKLVNNALMAANMGVSHAAMEAGAALKLDRAALAELIKTSSGRSFAFETYVRQSAPQAFAHGAALLTKDVNLLAAILDNSEDAEILRAAADKFLFAATAASTSGVEV